MIPTKLASLIFFPMAMGCLILGVTDVVQGQRSLAWPEADGTVLSSRLTHRAWKMPQPEIRYAYTVNGQQHVSDRLWPGMDIFPVVRGKRAEQIVADHPEGSALRVRVDPNDPGHSLVFPGSKRPFFWFLTLAFFVSLGIWIPFRKYYERPSKPA